MAEGTGSWGSPGRSRARGRPRPHVELLAGWPAIARLEREWRTLHAHDPRPVPCLAWEAVEALRATGLGRGLPAALLVHVGGRLAGILPLELHRTLLGVPLARFLGAGILDRHEPLLSPEGLAVDPLRVLAGLARALRHQPILDLGPLRADGIGAPWLSGALEGRLGWSTLHGLREYRLDLAGGWNRVRLSLPLPLREDARHGLERARRRAPTDVRIFRAREAGVVREILGLGPGSRAGSAADTLATGLLERGARRGKVIVGRLVVGGRLVAGVAAWMENHQASLVALRDDGKHGQIHPRRVLLVALVRHLAEREACSRILLPPARHDSRLGLVPREQVRLVGTLRAGLARALAGLGLKLGGGRRLVLPLAPWPNPGLPGTVPLVLPGRARVVLREAFRRAPARRSGRPANAIGGTDVGRHGQPLLPAEI